MTTCIHGNPWCENCKKLTNDSCNHYSSSGVQTYNNFGLNQVIKCIPVACTYAKNGCNENVEIEKIIEHEKICDYRFVNCFLCKNTSVFIQLNEHIMKNHEKRNCTYIFFEDIFIQMNPQFPSESKIKIFIGDIKKYFLLVYSFTEENSENKEQNLKSRRFKFCLQYLGKRKEAYSYLYVARIDQGLKSMYLRTARCMPYDDESETIDCKVSEIFLTEDYKSGFKMWIQIKPRN